MMRPACLGILAGLIAWGAAGVLFGGEAVSNRVSRLITDLNSEEFSAREAATQQLVAVGAEAVPALQQAAERGPLEVAVRAVDVLRRLYAADQEPEVAVAELALEALADSEHGSVAERAHQALESNYEIRERRAIAEIRRLGGVVKSAETLQGIPNSDPDRPGATLVILDRNWKGGDEGLKYIKRLSHLRVLYRVKGTAITEKGLASLQAALPHLLVHERGAACLGISGDSLTPGCVVRGVQEGSAAQQAGLAVNDVIVRFGGKEVPSFETLIQLIAEKEPGDKVETVIVREGQFRTITVELGGWTPEK